MDRLLDALHQVKWYHDGTLALRRSCAHGICGSDAMMINGRNALACKVLVKDVAPKVTVEPIRGLPVLKDLIVDMEPFFAGYRQVLPFLINDDEPPERERYQSPEDRERFDDTTKCILCASCTTSCPDLLGRRRVRRARRPSSTPTGSSSTPATRRPRTTPGHPVGPVRGLPLPNHVQLHGGLPSRHQGHQGDPGGQARRDVRQALMLTREELEALSSKELHDRAVALAKHRLDVGFYWRLIKAIPVAEVASGDLGESEADVINPLDQLNDLTEAGQGELADALRPLYIDYIEEHQH